MVLRLFLQHRGTIRITLWKAQAVCWNTLRTSVPFYRG